MKSFIPSDLVQVALAVGRNLNSIANPKIVAKIINSPDFMPSQAIKGRQRRAMPIDRARLWVIIRPIAIIPRKISNPYQYPPPLPP